ncbi:NAD(P)H-binding protein [Fluviicola sp.]|uniref:NAD(P)H-binding protein n=1 Tax=Fluviicola sp. TaxID=1917219 RepID=UPI0031DC284D
MTICISGASGLVGNELLIQLLNKPEVEKILVLSRSALAFNHPKMQVALIAFEELDQIEVAEKIDAGFCALGTTLKKAGSKERQQQIDRDFVVAFAAFCKRSGAEKIGIVSSIGADALSSNFYLRTKGEMEKGVSAIGIPHTVFIHPSLLVGQRKEFRLSEKIITPLSFIINPFLFGKARKYRSIRASVVAQKLIDATLTNSSEVGQL